MAAMKAQLLREAGEHLGTLAEEARDVMHLRSNTGSAQDKRRRYERWVSLHQLSEQLLALVEDR